MKIYKHVSKKERKLLVVFCFVVFAMSVANMAFFAVDKYNEKVEEIQQNLMRKAEGGIAWGVYGDYGDDRPFRRFSSIVFSFLVFMLVFKFQSIWASAVGSAISVIIFLQWFLRDYRLIVQEECCPELPIAKKLFLTIYPSDYLFFVLASTLLIWQMSVIRRSKFNFVRRNQILP
ncbi:MAG: hypothetical protein H7070_10845 [Saprospiraceae bacterium]|nr:hypothetical protein [Pyrinomonadaceae bacterium]